MYLLLLRITPNLFFVMKRNQPNSRVLISLLKWFDILENVNQKPPERGMLIFLSDVYLRRGYDGNSIQLSATDVLAPTSMKNAAKCDT